MKNWFKENWLKVFAIGVLLGALGQRPYGYYQLLRWVVTLAAAYVAYTAFDSDKNRWGWIFVAIAALFNPIILVHFNRETWQLIDIFTAGFFFSGFFMKKRS